MSSQRCPECGLLNWSDAESCKRCKTLLQPMDEEEHFIPAPSTSFETEKPAVVLGVLMVIWGVIITGAALFIYKVGGSIHPVVLLGPAILINGVLVMRWHSAAMGLYFLGLVGTCVWTAKADTLPVAIGGFIFFGLIGLMVARRRFPILAGALIVLSCLGFLAPFLIVGMLGLPSKVAWQDFRPAEGMFTVKMPSAPIAHDPQVERVGSYTMTNHPYECLVNGQGSTIYVVVDFSPAISTENVSYDQMLEGELSGLVRRTSSTLVTKKAITVNGYRGLEFELKPPENLALASPRSFGKIFMNSEHLYLMGITASEASELLAGKEDFLNPTLSYRSAATQYSR